MISEESESLTIVTIKDYLKLARVDHWFKNIFMLPGMVFAFLYYEFPFTAELLWNVLAGVLSTCLIASANYVINEWLDAEFDRHHPVKKHRPSVTKDLDVRWIFFMYSILIILGLGLAIMVSNNFFLFEFLLLVMGFLYNVRPFRTKERPYIDVLSESVNHPIRFILGWYIFVPDLFPPSSILVAYWMGGAFLMGCKRLAEYRFIGNPEIAGNYRRSFCFYTEKSLLISVFFYALTSTFFLGIFLIKHRIELLLTFPLFALLFSWYLNITMLEDSTAQKPEKLYTHWKFMVYCILLSIIFLALLFIDIPPLHYFLRNTFG